MHNYVFKEYPPAPYDRFELDRLDSLLAKIPLYEKRISELEAQISKLANAAKDYTNLSYSYEIEQMIYKAFFIDLENRPFTYSKANVISKLKADVVVDGVIKNRNLPCEICGESRAIDKCHILPSKMGGHLQNDNLLFLCPTHHRLFDCFMLSKSEWLSISWDSKSEPSRKYAESIILPANKKFWQRIEDLEFSKIEIYDADDTRPFYRYVINEILSLFSEGALIKRPEIYKVINPTIKDLSKSIVSFLVKENVLLQTKEGSQNILCLNKDAVISDDLITRCWQELS